MKIKTAYNLCWLWFVALLASIIWAGLSRSGLSITVALLMACLGGVMWNIFEYKYGTLQDEER